jgi:hypothetical protein
MNFEGEKGGHVDYQQLISYKNQKTYLMNEYNKLNLIMNLKAVTGVTFIKAALRKISVCKQLFVLDLEQGTEVYMSKELNQNSFPMAFRYYDGILNHC